MMLSSNNPFTSYATFFHEKVQTRQFCQVPQLSLIFSIFSSDFFNFAPILQRKDVQYAQLEETLRDMAADVAFLYEIYRLTQCWFVAWSGHAEVGLVNAVTLCANVTNLGAARLTNIKGLQAARWRQKHNFVRFDEDQKQGKLKVNLAQILLTGIKATGDCLQQRKCLMSHGDFGTSKNLLTFVLIWMQTTKFKINNRKKNENNNEHKVVAM